MSDESAEPDDKVRVHTKHADLSLHDLADALPGTSEIMASVSRRYSSAWYAAHGGNWDLAAHYLRGVRSRQRGLGVIRPKYAQQLADFERDALDPLFEAVRRRDLAAFEQAFEFGAERANAYHEETGRPYLRWKLPSAPPDDVDLGPGPGQSEPGAD